MHNAKVRTAGQGSWHTMKGLLLSRFSHCQLAMVSRGTELSMPVTVSESFSVGFDLVHLF